jgi:HSP90 family molecular chaperone
MHAQEVVALRQRLRWTQKNLADILKISVRLVQQLESGKKHISEVQARALTQVAVDHSSITAPRQLKMELDFKGLIAILAGHLYSKKDVFIREMIQNAHDAIWRRHHADPDFDVNHGCIDIVTDLATGSGRMVFRDNGVGMLESDLIDYLSAIGRSGTRAAQHEAPEVIGQFGIGFLSGFVVAGRIEVRTRHYTARPAEGCLWSSNGDQDYSISSATLDKIGTEVVIHLRDASERAVLHEDTLHQVITTYSDMLRVPIHVNDPQHIRAPVNMRIMPWERDRLPNADRDLENLIYLEKRVPDSVLEIIPINEPEAQGLLYITRMRVVGRNAPRTVRLFLKRMFLREGAEDLLPEWASFVNGLLNTTALQPNAARDNYVEDSNSRALRKKLGALVIAHLEELKSSNASRLSEILAFHDFSIKAACHYHEEFFDSFGHLLEWRVNPGSPVTVVRDPNPPKLSKWQPHEKWIRLSDLVNPGPPDGGPKYLSYFTSGASARQYFEMADAAGTTVLNASGNFEEELLKKWAKKHEARVHLIPVDRQDDPAVLRDIDAVADASVKKLAQYITANLVVANSKVDVEARRFSPGSVTSLLRESEESAGVREARSMLCQPGLPAEIKNMAEDLVLMSRNAKRRMLINADNPLVRDLAELVRQDPTNDDAIEIAIGLYNAAILANSEGIDPAFPAQFQRLLRRILTLAGKSIDVRRQEEELNRKLRASQPSSKRTRRHLQGFHITPFAASFDAIRKTIREIVEDEFRCELLSANQRKLKPCISDNVRDLIAGADFFVVDISDPASLNVMIEAGAVGYGRPEAPALFIAAVDKQGDKPRLPADMEGLIVHPYVRGADPTQWRSTIVAEFRTDAAFNVLLTDPQFERYIGAGLLAKWTKNTVNQQARAALIQKFPTLSAWRATDDVGVEAVLQQFDLSRFASVVRSVVIEAADAAGG